MIRLTDPQIIRWTDYDVHTNYVILVAFLSADSHVVPDVVIQLVQVWAVANHTKPPMPHILFRLVSCLDGCRYSYT